MVPELLLKSQLVSCCKINVNHFHPDRLEFFFFFFLPQTCQLLCMYMYVYMCVCLFSPHHGDINLTKCIHLGTCHAVVT